jgi:hypothetical protein
MTSVGNYQTTWCYNPAEYTFGNKMIILLDIVLYQNCFQYNSFYKQIKEVAICLVLNIIPDFVFKGMQHETQQFSLKVETNK